MASRGACRRHAHCWVASQLVLHSSHTRTGEKDVEPAPARTNEAAACMAGSGCHVGQSYAALGLTLFPDKVCEKHTHRGFHPITSELLQPKPQLVRLFHL